MGKDKWAKVIEYLKSSKRDPEKVLKLLKGSDKGTESSYTIARSSYSMNVIATITQKIHDPKNKGKNLTHIIRTWVNSKDFENFYNLIRGPENKKYDKSHREKYVKQINDLWTKPNQQFYRKYFEATKGFIILQTGSKTNRKTIKPELRNFTKKDIEEAIPRLKKTFNWK
jgi:hypothetical protein